MVVYILYYFSLAHLIIWVCATRLLRGCLYLGRECPYLGRACPYLGNEYCNSNMVMSNGIFLERLFVTEIRIDNRLYKFEIGYLLKYMWTFLGKIGISWGEMWQNEQRNRE